MPLKGTQPGTMDHTTRFEGSSPTSSIINRFLGDEPDWALIAEEWPTFLYDEKAGWNPENIRNGLFRGHVLVRVRYQLPTNQAQH